MDHLQILVYFPVSSEGQPLDPLDQSFRESCHPRRERILHGQKRRKVVNDGHGEERGRKRTGKRGQQSVTVIICSCKAKEKMRGRELHENTNLLDEYIARKHRPTRRVHCTKTPTRGAKRGIRQQKERGTAKEETRGIAFDINFLLFDLTLGS
jgi:hypothetical protein